MTNYFIIWEISPWANHFLIGRKCYIMMKMQVITSHSMGKALNKPWLPGQVSFSDLHFRDVNASSVSLAHSTKIVCIIPVGKWVGRQRSCMPHVINSRILEQKHPDLSFMKMGTGAEWDFVGRAASFIRPKFARLDIWLISISMR